MQEQIEETACFPFFLQNSRDIRVGIAGVNHDGHPGQPCRPDMLAKTRLLGLSRRAVVKVVEPGLADTDDPWLLSEPRDRFCFDIRSFTGVVRMLSDGAPDIRAGFRQPQDRAAPGKPGADG